MTTTSRFPSLCGSLLRIASVVLGIALCASAWADSTNKNVVSPKAQLTAQPAAPHKRVQVYVFSTASAIPLPIEQIGGPFPTTTHPLSMIGRQEHTTR